MPILTKEKKEQLIGNWNKVFNSDIKINEDILDSEILFNTFLNCYQKNRVYDYNENICICLKNKYKLNLYSAENNKIIFSEIGVNARKKFRNYINNYETIITNFYLDKNLIENCLKINPNKQFLRYEVLHNIFSGNKSNYLGYNIPFSNDNPAAFLTTNFINQLKYNENIYRFLKYSSYLLNYFESGMVINELVINPKINISNYGRWYWTGKFHLQQDKILRENIINNIVQSGNKYVSIDFISASSSMLAKITNSKIIKFLVKSRIKYADDIMYSDIIKTVLNIIVHSADSPENIYNNIKNKYSVSYIEKVGKFNLMELLYNLSDELLNYNNNIIDSYKTSLSFNELKRRIVNSNSIIELDKDIIKQHRIYLQGHVHDNIILLSKYIYDNIGVFPLYTIHDSINFYIDKSIDYDKFINVVKAASKEIQLPFRIEEY